MTSVKDFSSSVNKSAQKRPLGNTNEIRVHNSRSSSLKLSPVVLRFYLQSLARELLPKERVAKCLRHKQPHKDVVQVFKNDESKRAHYSGLIVCGSLWHCPVCAARISEARRQELAAAVAQAGVHHPDGSFTPLSFALGTFTASHLVTGKLENFLDGLGGAYRRFTAGRWYQDIKAEYGLIGSVRALEVTYGRNGWHFHIHTLFVFDAQHSPAALNGLKTAFKVRWRDVLAKHGLTASWDYGVDLKTAAGEVADYVAKFGHEPKNEGWGITHELTKAQVKKASRDGFTMNELLMSFGEGDVKSGRLWKEYAVGFKGRRQLVWSRGLRDLFGLGAEKDDGDLAAETESKTDRLLASLSSTQWRAVLRADVRGELLDRASNDSDEDFNLWLADIFARWVKVNEV